MLDVVFDFPRAVFSRFIILGGAASMVCMPTIYWIHDVLVDDGGSGSLRIVAVDEPDTTMVYHGSILIGVL